jgi:hypothetical protein
MGRLSLMAHTLLNMGGFTLEKNHGGIKSVENPLTT